MYRISRLLSPLALAFCFVAASTPAGAKDDPARLVVFGDSLSDSGGNPAPSPPYFEGRWSNGYTWADDLAPHFGLGGSLTPSSIPGGTNYARAAARVTGTDGVVDQISAYLQDVQWKADKHALYLVFIGGNDVRDALVGALTNPQFDPNTFLDRRLATLGVALTALSARGGRHIAVLGLPDLAHLPGLPPPAAPFAAFLSQRFNAGLARIVGQLEEQEGDASLIDVAALFNAILADAVVGGPKFGITNTTGTCLTFAGNVPIQCSSPDTYLFWDSIHPTARVHDLLATYVVNALDREGDGGR